MIEEAGPAPLVVIVGPTAAGKTGLSLEIARALDGEIVSADALQIYRGLEIGTATPEPEVLGAVPHHCVGVVSPEARLSAGAFARMARAAVAAIRQRGRRPVVVGGSGLYLRAMVEGLADLPASDPRWRSALESLEARRGLQHLAGWLSALDPGWSERIGRGDRQRTLRALEVILRTGRRLSDVVDAPDDGDAASLDAVWIGVTWPRETLYRRIEERVDIMLQRGWMEEVRRLLESGLPRDAHALQAIGYRDLVACLDGEKSVVDAREAIVRATRRYAKRQLTWFRNQTPARWFDASSPGLVDAVLAHVDARRAERGLPS